MAENQKHILVIVAGFAGSGKSTLADKLAQEIGAKCIHASGLLKELQQKKFSEINPHACEHNSGWWESNEGKKYMSQRLKDGSMDKELDEQLLKIIAGAKEKNENL
ncbi:hypothetical protein KKH30_00900, partial [Candidatus Micrarchaeota archaeon]|nr:hypothetical protein [Candidatus Micrarchaeota archaeon]